MPEAEEPVDIVQVRFLCEHEAHDGPACGLEMESTGYVAAINPPKYQHRCSLGHTTMLDKRYPALEPRSRQGVPPSVPEPC